MVYFFLYETKSLSVENVDAMYSDMSLKAWNSKKWVPAGYIDRKRRDSQYWRRRSSVVPPRGGSIDHGEAKDKDDYSPERMEEKAY